MVTIQNGLRNDVLGIIRLPDVSKGSDALLISPRPHSHNSLPYLCVFSEQPQGFQFHHSVFFPLGIIRKRMYQDLVIEREQNFGEFSFFP